MRPTLRSCEPDLGATLLDLAAEAAKRARGTKLERTLTELERAEISERIKQARLQAGLTQEELADLIHVRARTIANYESGRVPWRLLGTIAEVTGRTQEWLLHGDAVGAGSSDPELRALVTQLLENQRTLAAAVDGLTDLVERALVEARPVRPRKRRTA